MFAAETGGGVYD